MDIFIVFMQAEKELAKARKDIAHEARLAKEAEAEMDRHVAKAGEIAEREIAKHQSNKPNPIDVSAMDVPPMEAAGTGRSAVMESSGTGRPAAAMGAGNGSFASMEAEGAGCSAPIMEVGSAREHRTYSTN